MSLNLRSIDDEVRHLISCIEGIQDWSGTAVGDAIEAVESAMNGTSLLEGVKVETENEDTP
jgi:hypothetical protein